MDDIVTKYSSFLVELTTYAPVIILSTPLATVRENEKCNDSISGVRASTNISKKQRTQLSLELNKRIKEFCKDKNNLFFIDFDTIVLSKDNVVKTWLLNHQNRCDHHYKRWIYALLIIYKLKTNYKIDKMD